MRSPSSPPPRDLSRLSEAALAEDVDLLDSNVSFSVQSRILPDLPYKPFDVNRAIAAALADATAAPLDVRQPFQILSVVCAAAPDAAGAQTPRRRFWVSLSASHNLSDWAGGVRRFRREKEQISQG